MKERDNLASFGIPSSDVGAFALVAVQAGELQILHDSFPAVLPGNDVVNVKRARIPEGRHMAIFTAPLGPLPDVANQVLSQ